MPANPMLAPRFARRNGGATRGLRCEWPRQVRSSKRETRASCTCRRGAMAVNISRKIRQPATISINLDLLLWRKEDAWNDSAHPERFARKASSAKPRRCGRATSSLGIQTYFESKSLARFCCDFLNLQHLAESAFSKSIHLNEAQIRHALRTCVRGHEGAGIVVNVSQWISRIRIGEIRTLVLG